MANPVYLWLKGVGGADIKGSVGIKQREGSIEVLTLDHSAYIPTDNPKRPTVPCTNGCDQSCASISSLPCWPVFKP
jgi:type VI protein secretion system component Hcp